MFHSPIKYLSVMFPEAVKYVLRRAAGDKNANGLDKSSYHVPPVLI